ncbi:MAG: DUF2062 domain-containing protein [Gammaproteobacteria bacterium]|nr:DUF2062 domain-containing protein [Gammaproteobacteria bacterium]
MPRDFLKRHLPSPDALRRRKGLAMFRGRMSDPELWHLTRRSVSAAIGVGLFLSMVPLPGQMPLAAVLALRYRFNLPVVIAAVFVTNPLTMPAIYLFAYELGALLLNTPPPATPFEFTVAWLSQRVGEIWQPLALGCLILGVLASAAGFFGTQLLWRWHVLQRWEKRRMLRRLRER